MTSQFISCLEKGGHLSLHEGMLCKGSGWKHFFSSNYHWDEVVSVANYILNKIGEGPSWTLLGDRLVTRYQKDQTVAKIIETFDHKLAEYRKDHSYLYPSTTKLFAKWQKLQLPEDCFTPEFADFLDRSFILSGLKLKKGMESIKMAKGNPSLLVNGQWVSAAELYRRFEIQKSPLYNETFLIEKETRDVYTYLPNGTGLQKHHPYQDILQPITRLSEAEYQAVLTTAQKFQLEVTGPHVLQLVTSYNKAGNTNFHQHLRNTKHPYIRLIIGEDLEHSPLKKGDVYDMGFMLGSWSNSSLSHAYSFLSSGWGKIRSPDAYEYQTADERVVTSIPISDEGGKNLLTFVTKYYKDSLNLGTSPSFHFAAQNCSVFAKKCAEAAGITVPTEIPVKTLLYSILPTRIHQMGQAIARFTSSITHFVGKCFSCILPSKGLSCLRSMYNGFLWTVAKIRDITLSLFLSIGGVIITKVGKLFHRNEPPTQGEFTIGDKRAKPIKPFFASLQDWFTVSDRKAHLPSVMQEWQRKHPSTVIYTNPVGLTIVPASKEDTTDAPSH